MLVAALALGGCARVSDSRFNPLNWFERDAQQAERPRDIRPLVPPDAVTEIVDARPLVAAVSDLEVTPTFGGILVRAFGTATDSGAYSAQLTLAETSASEITLDFRAFQGRGAGGARVTVARFITNSELGGARTIRVRSASNALTRQR